MLESENNASTDELEQSRNAVSPLIRAARFVESLKPSLELFSSSEDPSNVVFAGIA